VMRLTCCLCCWRTALCGACIQLRWRSGLWEETASRYRWTRGGLW
jgi:hypothetical protein